MGNSKTSESGGGIEKEARIPYFTILLDYRCENTSSSSALDTLSSLSIKNKNFQKHI